jgi:flagellar hook-length control protein FliK
MPNQSEISAKNELFEAENAGNPLPNKVFSDFTETPFSLQKNVSSTEDEKPENMAQASISSQKSNIQAEIHSAQASIHKMNASMEQISSLEAEKQQNMSENADSNVDFNVSESEQLSADTTGSPVMAEKASFLGETVKVAVNSNSGLGLGRQVQESVSSIYRPGTQQMVIRLDPPDLGRITIRFTEQRDGITGILHVEKSQTKQEIQQTLPGIVQHLQNSDVHIKKLEVVLNNQPQNDTAEEHSANQNGNFGEQNSPHQNSSGNTVSYNEWLANSDNAANHSTTPQIELTDQSINMLI